MVKAGVRCPMPPEICRRFDPPRRSCTNLPVLNQFTAEKSQLIETEGV